MKLTKIISENKQKIPVIYIPEFISDYGTQENYELGMYRKDKKGLGEGILGYVAYSIYEDVISVKIIEVHPDYRRMGVGSRLIQKMKELHPNSKYKPSLMTSDGAKFKHKKFSKQEMEYI